jgi:hypothetical protein
LSTAWLVLFAYRLLLDSSDRLTLWALRLLTIAILVIGGIWVGRFVEERIRSVRRGAPVFTQKTVLGLLLATAVVGLALRIVAWDPGREGIVAWIGGIMLILSIVCLIVFQFLVERGARSGRESFYFNPPGSTG